MRYKLPSALFAAAMMVSASMVLAKPLDPDKAIPFAGDVKSPQKQALFKQVKIGSVDLALETNNLGDVEKAFGGKLGDQGDAGDSSYWLCYAGPDAKGAPSIFWFVSGEMGGSDHGILTIAQEPNPGGSVPEGCVSAPAGLTSIDFGIPGIGADVSQVTAHFGAAKPDHHGNFGYVASYPSVELKDFVVTQSLVYTIKDGKIVGVAVSQSTVN
jgi:hypothetical protein